MIRTARGAWGIVTPMPSELPPTTAAPAGPPAPPPGAPWRNRDFRRLFGAALTSQLGTQTGHVAMPLVAVTALGAGPGQVGALATFGTLAFLLIGLPAGAWVDRLRRRRLMITADLVRAALLVSVPLAWWADRLTLEQLYGVVLLSGCATVFFDVALQSHLPHLVGRDGLIAANAGLVALNAAGNVAGRGVGGWLVQLLSAPAAVGADAVSHLGSALLLSRIRRPEPDPDRSEDEDEGEGEGGDRGAVEAAGEAGRPGLVRQIGVGLRFVLGNRELLALTLGGALTNLGSMIVNTMLPVLFVSELGLSAGMLGLFWAVGGIGVFLGARLARPLAARLGIGRTLGAAGIAVAPAGLLLPLLDTGLWLGIAGAGWMVAMAKVGVDNVLAVTLRQRRTPDALLGRMNATFRFVLMGALTLGAALAGVLGEVASVRAALWVGGGVLALVWLPVMLSPVRRLRDLPAGPSAGDQGLTAR